MADYRTKINDFDYKERVAVYRRSIEYDDGAESFSSEGTGHRQKYTEMSEAKQKDSDERRIRYYKRKVYDLIEIALMNPDLNVMLTLTFEKEITSYNYAITEWQLFLKRLRHSYNGLKYICVWEFQQERSRKANIETGGIFHFHVLMNTGFIEHDQLEKLWGNGFVWIEKLDGDEKHERAIRYATKYCVKELTRRIEAHEDIRGQRFFFTSNNLRKPSKRVVKERLNLDELIVEHLEDMQRDGSYEIKNARGKTINRVEYIEYRK